MKDFSKNLVIHKPVENPKCEVKGCSHTAHWTGHIRKDGSRTYRKYKEVGYICSRHHHQLVVKNRGLSSMAEVVAKNAGFDKIIDYQNHLAQQKGFENYIDYQNHFAIEKGFENYTEYRNSIHPYRKFRKDYCENIDGRLGYTCTTTIVHMVQLDVDHKDGNHLNNKPKNLQTLCKCCHSYKGLIYEDYKSPGRKTRKVI